MFAWREDGALKYLVIEEFMDRGVKVYFTSRLGGVSSGDYHSLNLGLHTADSKEDVLENRRRLAEALKIDCQDFVAAQQVHSNKVVMVNKNNSGQGAFSYESSLPGIDGLITADRGLPLISFYADCVPLLLMDPVKGVVGLAHAGWRGTVKKIGVNTISLMKGIFDCQLDDIWVGIGPAISRDYYQVDERVVAQVKGNFPCWRDLLSDQGKDRYLFDLWAANRAVFHSLGIQDKQIILSNYCTAANTDLFFSYRKEKGRTGRMASIIYL
ncbi:peptidoglycan editing factor PgeF [Iocasia frigidifontis]|uniref:Purine nucleoside phosphorylase n=1 Tax=Iocasia fonsfrigidae TaxID=2682810 RepID=A0A8A7KJK6_9FIRM|nr:peptidoglycan editing factor PgeF [Iocasia fonsfrigidae]QTL98052.1 peptidoglycan editing factor PgeF [Iocasia fonsfrigidae]